MKNREAAPRMLCSVCAEVFDRSTRLNISKIRKSEVLSLPSIVSVLQLKPGEEKQEVQASFSDPSDTDAGRSQNLEQQNNMSKEQTASLEFFQSTTVSTSHKCLP
ncbi:hypothetical protein DUI87_07566 [Hirundo rustica rustica]|uniref:Uncharacterized protein n=1 Tax=Hirundo rustica rustica TaxID=333673 RepID=A0A3M0KQD8_HIRRU|nr:hypothetical protein DUI87_07566 [Hirundo rustica rustica]